MVYIGKPSIFKADSISIFSSSVPGAAGSFCGSVRTGSFGKISIISGLFSNSFGLRIYSQCGHAIPIIITRTSGNGSTWTCQTRRAFKVDFIRLLLPPKGCYSFQLGPCGHWYSRGICYTHHKEKNTSAVPQRDDFTRLLGWATFLLGGSETIRLLVGTFYVVYVYICLC